VESRLDRIEKGIEKLFEGIFALRESQAKTNVQIGELRESQAITGEQLLEFKTYQAETSAQMRRTDAKLDGGRVFGEEAAPF